MTDTPSMASQGPTPTVTLASLERMTGLDALRGFAAVAVLFYHCHALLGLQMWPSWTGYLSMAVPLFFSLSAFSLCLRYNGRLGVSDSVADFYLRRYRRIAPLFYFMLSVYMARRVLNGWSLPGIDDILLNLTFLFPLDPETNESLVAAGWSLGLEMIFYSMFPIIIAVVTNFPRAFALFAAAVVIQAASGYVFFRQISGSNFYWLSFPTQSAFFASGILAYHVYLRLQLHVSKRKSLLAGVLLAVSALALVYGTRQGLFEVRLDGWPGLRPLIGFLLTTMVVALALRPFPVLVNRLTVFLGEISYGLYLVHPFVILVLGRPLLAALESSGLAAPEAAALVIAAVLFSTIAAATASFYWLERPMMNLHKLSRTRPSGERS